MLALNSGKLYNTGIDGIMPASFNAKVTESKSVNKNLEIQ